MADNLSLKRIAITPKPIFEQEPAIIKLLLSNGWDMVHLRHPDASLRDMRNLIESLPQNLHSRLRLHGHFELCHSFNLGGLHLNSRCPLPPDGYCGPVSKSCHSTDEVLKCGNCDYVTLSPIFDSVSKLGYNSNFSPNELLKINSNAPTAIIALGGVTPDKIPDIKSYGFSGYAVLGALMNHIDNPIKFNQIISEFNT